MTLYVKNNLTEAYQILILTCNVQLGGNEANLLRMWVQNRQKLITLHVTFNYPSRLYLTIIRRRNLLF